MSNTNSKGGDVVAILGEDVSTDIIRPLDLRNESQNEA